MVELSCVYLVVRTKINSFTGYYCDDYMADMYVILFVISGLDSVNLVNYSHAVNFLKRLEVLSACGSFFLDNVLSLACFSRRRILVSVTRISCSYLINLPTV